MAYIPDIGDICILTSVNIEDQIARGLNIIPCFVEIEYQNDYCWLVRYKDSGQCGMIRKSDDRYSFKES